MRSQMTVAQSSSRKKWSSPAKLSQRDGMRRKYFSSEGSLITVQYCGAPYSSTCSVPLVSVADPAPYGATPSNLQELLIIRSCSWERSQWPKGARESLKKKPIIAKLVDF